MFWNMQTVRPIRLIAAISAGFICPWIAWSAAGQDSRWLSEHEHAGKEGRYYEGLLDQPNGRWAYEVLGFFAYAGSERPRLDVHPAPKSELNAWFYLAKQDQGNLPPSSITIRAKQIANHSNYLLKTLPILAHNGEWTHFSWNTDPFITRYQINPNNLAVLAQSPKNERGENEIFPAVFALDCKNAQISHYELMLRIQEYSLADLSYVVRSPASGNAPAIAKTCHFTFSDVDTCGPPALKRATRIEVGTVVELHIPMTAPPGWVSLHIFGPYKDSSERLNLTYNFFHQPDFHCMQ